jgi:hypothetical protein
MLLDFSINFLYNFMFESLKSYDVSNVKQYIVDRRNNKTFDNIESYLRFHNKPIKPFYYKSGTGPDAIYSTAYINIHNEERIKTNKDFYIAGSSGASIISTLIKCKKNKLNLDTWFQNLEKDNLLFYEWFNLFRDSYIMKNFTIDDFYYDEIFINVLCFDPFNNEFKIMFFTNFKDLDDLCDCIQASCFIPKITNKNSIYYFDRFFALDAGFIDYLFNFTYSITNENYEENDFLKNCYNYLNSPYKNDFSKNILSSFFKNYNNDYSIKIPFKQLFHDSKKSIEK